ncbi:hypothetical protein V494_00343 [Pseudogymnoascus sp. VKM F-4513 (FW-928)]|nr:hypothetical protein V494_00343 [Pseudogymnoascus sp. VKM F-4513 (FW-928)]
MASLSTELHDSSNNSPRTNVQSSPESSRSNNNAGLDSNNLPAPLVNNESDTTPAPAQSILKIAWSKLGINGTVAALVFKGALAPLIATAMYQSKSVARIYVNFGYLIIVVSILSVTFLPRGKFMMNISISVLLTCFAMAMVLLGQYAGVKARQHTTPAEAPPNIALGYNSSASAVNAIFLTLNLFGINTLRAARPAFSIPAVGYNIFVLIGFTYGPQMATVQRSVKFSKELFYSFLTGQAVGAGVSLLVIPVSSRKVFFGEATGFLQSCRGLLKTQIAFVEALEYSQMECALRSNSRSASGGGPETGHAQDNQPGDSESRQRYNEKASSLKASSAVLLTLGGKLRDDVVFAKREIAFGHFKSKHIHEMHRLFMNLLVPIIGFSTITDISERLNHRFCSGTDLPEELDSSELAQTQYSEGDSEAYEWRELIGPLHASLEPFAQILDNSILHILILFKFVSNPNRAKSKSKKPAGGVGREGVGFDQDVEKGDGINPGDIGFGDYLDETINKYRGERTENLKAWAAERGFSYIFHDTQERAHLPPDPNQGIPGRQENSRETRFSERLHLIFYMEYLMYSVSKAILALIRFAESMVADGTMDKRRFIFPSLKTVVKLVKGIIHGEDSDPGVDKAGSMEVDVHTVSLGHSLLAPRDPEHLPPKNLWQTFGDRLRVIPTFFGSGPAKFGARVTIASMSIAILAYLRQTHPFFIGYELQVRVEGREAATATGQVFYEIYLLAPYRLLAVGGGVIVAYVFTVFPVPITEGSVLRRDLGSSLFLLASYVSSTTSTVDHRLQDKEGDMSLSSSPGRKLEKSRQELLQKQFALQNSMRRNLSFMDWGLNFGGEFPKEIYTTIIVEIQNIVNYLAVINFASETFIAARKESPAPAWLSELAQSRPEMGIEALKTPSLLILLSASIKIGKPLPPYLDVPTDTHLSRQMHCDKMDIITFQNLNEPGFRALAVIKLAQSCMADSLTRIVEPVRELVGEVDFGYHIVDSNDQE